MNRRTKKMKLKKETLRSLDKVDLSRIAGGALPKPTGTRDTDDVFVPGRSDVDCISWWWCA
jgi:hypothetical protein